MAERATAYPLGRQQRRLRNVDPGARVLIRVPLPAQIGAETTTDRIFADRLARVAANHEALRTTVVVPAGLVEAVQLVSDQPTVTARVVDTGQRNGGSAGRALEVSCDALAADLATLQQVADVVCGRVPDADDPIQFAEYAQWQDELGGEPVDGAAEFWSSYDTAVWTPLPDVETSATDPDRLQPATVSWPGLMCCALAILSGDETIAFGVEVDARHTDELTGAAGPYAEVLPLVVGIDAADTVNDIAQRCEAQLDQIGRFHEWAPDSLLADAVIVLGRGDPAAVVPRPGAEAELRVAADGSAVVLAAGGPAGPAGNGHALDGLTATLRALRDVDPAARIGELEILVAAGLSPAESATPGPEALDVLRAIAEWARRTPDRVALRSRHAGRLTYRELVDAIGGTLDRIDELSSSAGPIAVLADRSAGAVVGVLAALWSGRGYLPIDANQPPARLRAALDDCGCDLLLADHVADLAGFAELDQHDLVTERVGPSWKPRELDLPPPPDPQALAYVILTSGSTGAAKGVEVTLGNLGVYLAGVRTRLGLEDGWNWALATLIATDLGNTALFGALAGGGTLTVLDADEVLDADAFGAALEDGQVDAVKITPTHLASLLSGERRPLPRRLVVLGGERLPWTLVDRVRAAAEVRIANHYGPTETTVGALAYEITGDEGRSSTSAPIGRPLPGVQVSVRAVGGARVPLGAAGELYVSGGGVARGYRGDAARTAERFIVEADGVRWYRTGDIVRFRRDGEVEFLGRRDGQVKIRGYRVETGEIEAALLGHPGVQRAAVIPASVEPATGLAAYFVSHYHPSPSAAELREHLARTVPAHMAPSWFVELERLPMTGNGKLDVRALPEPSAELEQSISYVEPQNLIEHEVAAVFGDLLHQDRVGRFDDFFRLGGHSLLATQVVMRIRQVLAVELPIQSIFLRPTVQALAGEIEGVLLADIDEQPRNDSA